MTYGPHARVFTSLVIQIALYTFGQNKMICLLDCCHVSFLHLLTPLESMWKLHKFGISKE